MQKPTQIFVIAAFLVAFLGIITAGPQSNDSGNAGVEACMSCHPDRFGEWKSSGHVGTDKGIACTSCHTPHIDPPASDSPIDPVKTCENCHVHRATLQGKGAKGIEETRSMHSSIACTGCHMSDGNHRMKVIMPDDPDLSESRIDSCTACHKDDSREIRAHQIKDYRAWYWEAMDPLKADLEAFENRLKENPGLLNEEMQSKLDDIKANLSIIINDGSDGIHNLDYALEIMALAKRDLKKIKAAVE